MSLPGLIKASNLTDNVVGFNVGILDALGSIQRTPKKNTAAEIRKVTKPRLETYHEITVACERKEIKISSSFVFQTTSCCAVQLLSVTNKLKNGQPLSQSA